MTLKEKIREYVNDHFKHFGFDPYDVDGITFSYETYWNILNDNQFKESVKCDS